MNEILEGRDILDLAIKAEEKGLHLYKTLAKNSRNFHVSKIFKELAEEEKRHLDELKRWHDSVVSYRPMEAYPGEYILYIKAMADENTFKCDKACEKFLEQDVSEKDTIAAGITFEKDFILFLHNLKRHIKKSDEKVVDSIIESEEAHLKKLYTMQKKIGS